VGQHSKITVAELTRLLEVVTEVSEETGCTASEAIEKIERLITGDAFKTVKAKRAAIADFVGNLRKLRLRRKEFVGADLFRDPAWDMLLELFSAHTRGKMLSITSLCYASGSPHTTALRHVQRLEKHGLIERVNDPHDERRSFVRPTPKALEGIEAAAATLIQQTRYVDPWSISARQAPKRSVTE
jgi:DNA-binding MarR family transcriptional regulator